LSHPPTPASTFPSGPSDPAGPRPSGRAAAGRRRTAVLVSGALGAGLAASLSLAAPATAASVNLLSNPGFESGSLSGWSCDAGTAAVVSSPVHTGSYAMAGTPSSSDDAQCTQTVSVQPNTSYTLSGYVEGSYVYLGVTGGTSTWTPSASSWQQLSVTFTTGASQTSVQVYVHGWYAQPTYYADDLALTGPAGSSSPPSASPSASASASVSASASASPTGTSTGTSGPWTHPVYWMPLDNAAQPIGSVISASGETEYNLSFVLDSGGCTPAWDGVSSQLVSSDTAVLADVNAIRAAGGDVAVTFGGYNGTELGSSCGSASALAAAYQQVVSKYNLTHVDFDYENGALDANTAVRFGAIATLEKNNPNLKVSLTIPMTTVGFPGTGTDEIQQAKANGARLDVINIMDFDTGLTSGTETAQTETIAQDAIGQLESIYGWSAAQAWSHLGITLMNGHTDQPSELFLQSDFTNLLGFAKSNHPALFSFWSANRDFACPSGVVEPWAPGTCSNVTQNPYDFTKIIVQYGG
jgi:hypothetical protein